MCVASTRRFVRVVAAIERAAAGDPRADICKLAGSDEHRLRVGESSVRFRGDAASRELAIPRVLPRGRAYDR
jgi:hypothetical protein